jgi:peptidoglycan hydrolase-like protein with peptidoglycan-binding domain
MSVRIPGVTYANIVDKIVVHLGKPDEPAENVTISLIDYIKNVASSELYPTWPEEALRANIYAIVSITLNRLFTQWYRAQGYNFDITNSTQFDQAFVKDRGTFENVDEIVNEIFDEYIRREGNIEPLFAQYCDGRISQCDGMYQWGSVDLANQGYTPLEILQYYYGNNIEIVTAVPLDTIDGSFRGSPISKGDSGVDVLVLQYRLNRISNNFPAIPKIPAMTGYYGDFTEAAVTQFQTIFKLNPTGIVNRGTWYEIRHIFNAVTKISELASKGLSQENISRQFSGILIEGEATPRILLLQFFLNLLSSFYASIPSVVIDGYFGPETRTALIEFQKTMNLPMTGLVDQTTWDIMYRSILGIVTTIPPSVLSIPPVLLDINEYSGVDYERGMGTEYPGVFVIQELLAYISSNIPDITYVPYNLVDGVFGPITESAVITFQQYYGLEPTGIVNETTWNKLVEVYRNLRYGESAELQLES